MERKRIALLIALLVAACILCGLSVMASRRIMTIWYEVCAYSDGTSYQDKLSAATSLIKLEPTSGRRFLFRARLRRNEVGLWCNCPGETRGHMSDGSYYSVIPEGCFDEKQSGGVLNDARAAIVDYSEVIKRDPSCEAYAERGQLYRLMKDYDEAIADFTAAITITPSDDCRRECLRTRATAYLAKGSFPQAIADLTSLIDSPGYEARAWDYKTRGKSYARFGKGELAKRDLEHAASLAKQEDPQ